MAAYENSVLLPGANHLNYKCQVINDSRAAVKCNHDNADWLMATLHYSDYAIYISALGLTYYKYYKYYWLQVT